MYNVYNTISSHAYDMESDLNNFQTEVIRYVLSITNGLTLYKWVIITKKSISSNGSKTTTANAHGTFHRD